MKKINTGGLWRRLAFRPKDLRRQPTARLANLVFYVLIGIAAVVFALFRLVGFDIPYDENPDYNAPLLTGVLIVFMLCLVAGALALAVWSYVRAARMSARENRVVNNVPARRIAATVACAVAVALVATFLLSSTDAITVNGARYDDPFWLRASGMFIATSILMILAAVAAVAFGATRNRRK